MTSIDRSYLIDANGEYVVADTTIPNGLLVTDRQYLTSNARHIVARTGSTVIAAYSGRDVYTRGGIGPLVTDRPSLIVQPLPIGGVTLTTAFLTESGNRLLTESGSYLSYP